MVVKKKYMVYTIPIPETKNNQLLVEFAER